MNRLLQKYIKEIHDHLYANSNLKTPELISAEVCKIIHAGIFIENKSKTVPAFAKIENFLNVESGLFSFSKEKHEQVKWIKEIFSAMNHKWKLYVDEKINLSDADILFVAYKLKDIVFSEKDNDMIGDAIEIFRSYYTKSLGGQFFTDQNVTRLAMELLEFNPFYGDVLTDLCTGTGGFLLAGINHIHKLLVEQNIFREDKLANLASKSIVGFEIDASVASFANHSIQARIGKKAEYVKVQDTLKESAGKKYTCLATNPPFGTKITIKDTNVLSNYTISQRKKSGAMVQTPTPPDILFIEQNINHLDGENGRLAIVLPYQLLSGPKALPIRDWILERCIVVAVVDLPTETFQPHTGTKTSLVVLKKRNRSKLKYNVFMSIPQWIGHDRRGCPVYKRNEDGSMSNEVLCDFDKVIEDWKKFKKGEKLDNKISFSVKSEQIDNDPSKRINAKFYKEELGLISKNVNHAKYDIVKLKDVTQKIFYPGRFKRNYIEKSKSSVPFLGGSNISDHILHVKKYISSDDRNIESLIVKEGWILVTRSGTTGIVSSVPKAWDGFAISEHVIRIVPDDEKLNRYYLLSFLNSESAQNQMARGIFGSVIDEISPEFLSELTIPIPKNGKLITSVCSLMESYETNRNQSITSFYKAQKELDEILINSLI